jgi:hypothetical protein
MKKILCAFIGGCFLGAISMDVWIRRNYMLLKHFRYKRRRFNRHPKEKWEFPED